jgi:hypothetical protein
LTRRRLPLLLTVLVSLPSVGTGFLLDDWLQRAVARGQLTFTSKLELFSFGSGRPEELALLIHRGPFPWFSVPDLKLRFFRPLSSALILFDTTVFGDAAVPQHLHSIAWAVAMTAVAVLLYRKLVPAVAVLAGCAFALDDAHALPTMWLANRNALVAATFVFLGLWLHVRWREGGSRAAGVGALISVAVGLCAGETAVACLAYVAAYELIGRRDALMTRARALAPTVALLGLYAVVYKWTASGARGSATYIDPVSEPLVFLSHAPARFLANLGSQTFGLPDLWLTLPLTQRFLIGSGVLALPVWFAAWRRWAPQDAEERRTLAWLSVGAVLSMVPTLATFPAARLLTAASLGLAPLVATFLVNAWRDVGLRRAAGVFWLVGCFGLASALAWLSLPVAFHAVGTRTVAAVRALDLRPDERVVLVSSTEFAAAVYGVPITFEEGLPSPKTWHIWSMAQHAVALHRTSERQVELSIVDGAMLDSVFEQNFRNPTAAVPVGLQVPLEGQRLTVLEVNEGRPVRVRVDSELPPEAFSFVWWNGAVLERLQLPVVGERRVLPRVPTIFEALLTGAQVE